MISESSSFPLPFHRKSPAEPVVIIPPLLTGGFVCLYSGADWNSQDWLMNNYKCSGKCKLLFVSLIPDARRIEIRHKA